MSEYKLKLNNGSYTNIDIEIGDYVIDCGANVGCVTDAFHKAGANVVAFEPNPHAFEKLQQRFDSCPRVKCIQKAVSNVDNEQIKLLLHENANSDQLLFSTGSSILEDKVNININTYVWVKTINLSRFISDCETPIKVLKIDIEGAEIEVLNNLMDTGIIKSIPYVFVETHEQKIPSLVDATQQLRDRIRNEHYSNINLDWI